MTQRLSIIMPCLNEAETLALCIIEARLALQKFGIDGEIIIADNGSDDGSQQIAERSGARVVDVPEKGYGSALRGGISAAQGEFIVMGDADCSYDFTHAPQFLDALRGGADLVMGNRFLGGVEPGAMPWKHRYIGNPVLSWIGRLLFNCPAGDFHCGLRGFRKNSIEGLNLSTTGMEFASEMIIKATLQGLKIQEIPTVLRPDGRSRPPHLRSWRDGWRHLRLMLLYCPRWLFLVTGYLCFVTGVLVVSAIALLGQLEIGGGALSVNSSFSAAMVGVMGFQLLFIGTFARQYASAVGLQPPNPFIKGVAGKVSLEHGILLGVAALVSGGGLLYLAFLNWRSAGFGPVSSLLTVSQVIPAVTLGVMGVQTIFGSFLLSMIGVMPKR